MGGKFNLAFGQVANNDLRSLELRPYFGLGKYLFLQYCGDFSLPISFTDGRRATPHDEMQCSLSKRCKMHHPGR